MAMISLTTTANLPAFHGKLINLIVSSPPGLEMVH